MAIGKMRLFSSNSHPFDARVAREICKREAMVAKVASCISGAKFCSPSSLVLEKDGDEDDDDDVSVPVVDFFERTTQHGAVFVHLRFLLQVLVTALKRASKHRRLARL
jgi:hypothetical protein